MILHDLNLTYVDHVHSQRLRELERIRAGKEMLAVKAKADEADRKRALEVRLWESSIYV